MTDELAPIVAAVAGGTTEPVGWFSYDLSTRTWVWSDSLFRMHGWQPGEIVPTTAVFLGHKHPDDLTQTQDQLTEVLATGQPFCCRHRIITTDRQVRTVVSIGQGVLDEHGAVVRVGGYLVDITDAAIRASREELQDAVYRSAASRADIDQAKGALMVVQGISADDAFALLRWHSSHANIKLREVATIITRGIRQPLSADETPAARVSRLLADLAGRSSGNGTPVYAQSPGGNR